MCSVCWPSNPFKYCYERTLGFLPAFPAPSLTTSVSLCRYDSFKLFMAHTKSQHLFFFHTSCLRDISSSQNTVNLFSYPETLLPLPAPHHCFVCLTSVLTSCAQLLSEGPPGRRNCCPGWAGCSSSCSLNIHCSFWILFVYLSPSLALGKILEGKTASYLPEYPQGLLNTDVQNTTHSNFCVCLVAGHWSTLSPIHLATFPTLTT